MHRWKIWASDQEGSAAIEFVTAGVLLLVPLVYLVIALGTIQDHTLGAEAAARHTARAIGQSSDATAAGQSAERIVANIRDEYGLSDIDTAVRCVPEGESCPRPGATIVVSVRTHAELPLLSGVEFARIPIEASAAQKISRAWGATEDGNDRSE